MPWLRRAVQERRPWKGWGHSWSHWDAPLELPPVRVGFAPWDTRLGEGICQQEFAPSHPAPYPFCSSAAGWEQGKFTWVLGFGAGHCWCWSQPQPGWCSAAWPLQPRFGGFSTSSGWAMVGNSPDLAGASGTMQKKTGGSPGSCFLRRRRSPSGSSVPGGLGSGRPKAPFSASGAVQVQLPAPWAPAGVKSAPNSL